MQILGKAKEIIMASSYPDFDWTKVNQALLRYEKPGTNVAPVLEQLMAMAKDPDVMNLSLISQQELVGSCYTRNTIFQKYPLVDATHIFHMAQALLEPIELQCNAISSMPLWKQLLCNIYDALVGPCSRRYATCFCDKHSGTCLAGDNTVLMQDGSMKPIAELYPGDKVFGGASVLTRVEFKNVKHEPHKLLRLSAVEGSSGPCSGILITPYHPVMGPDNKWAFPCDLCPHNQEYEYRDIVYNFVLDSVHMLFVGSSSSSSQAFKLTPCVTLAHGFNDPVVHHPYFGTYKVIEDLKSLFWNPWGTQGQVITVVDVRVRRDPNTGLVCGLWA